MSTLRVIKRIFCVLLCICLVIALSGCWSMKEPKDLAVVNSSMYLLDGDGKYKIVTEILNPEAQGGPESGSSGGKSPSFTVSAEGETVRQAISNFAGKRSKVDFGAHNKARFFSESFVRKDIVSALDMIARDHLTDERPIMMVVKDKDPEKIYKSMMGEASAAGEFIDNVSHNQPKYNTMGVFVTTLDFINDYYTEGKEPVMGVIELVDSTDKPSGNSKLDAGEAKSEGSSTNPEVVCEGLAAFIGNRMVGYLSGDETRCFNYIENKVVYDYISVPTGEGRYTVLKVVQSKAEIMTYSDGDKVAADISIKVVANVAQNEGTLDVTDPVAQKNIEADFNKLMEQKISDTVKKVQLELKSDIFGIGRQLHIQHNDLWEGMKDNWNDYFSKADINVTVSSSIALLGEIEKPFAVEGAHQ